MSTHRSNSPAEELVNEEVRPSNSAPGHVKRAKPEFSHFGLSPAQFARVMRAMLAVARLVGRHSAVSPRDAVQQAWVKALSNPETKRPSIQNFEQFVTYMCTLAKYEAMTNHQFSRRQEQRHVQGETDIAEWVVEQNAFEATEARLILEGPFQALEPEEQELLHSLYHDGKTIEEIKEEQGLAWSTVNSRKQQLLNRLSAALRALVAMLLLAPKKARAFVVHASRQLPQLASTMTVIAVCGVLLPTSSYLQTDAANPLGLTQVESNPTGAMKTAGLPPSFVPEVAPEEPKEVDTATNACSAEDMKCTKTASPFAENLMPMTFVLGVALSQVACAGSAQQTPAVQEPEEEQDGMPDPYEVMCDNERMRGNKCMTREEFRKWLGHD